MADILIRGMELPESCFECILTTSFFRNLHCDKLDGMSGFVGPLPHADDRHPDCPLVPLPEGHGRLGDLDALMSDFVKARWEFFSDGDTFLRLLKQAPTIIPAEGGTEECSEN